MTVFDRLGPLLILVLGALAVLVPLALFLVAGKLAGIERALWALRSELERARPAAPRVVPAARPAADTAEAPGPHPVSSSMFGR
jgi:hypothetical protein